MHRLIDSHAHLEEAPNLDEALVRAREAGVVAIIAVGSNYESNQRVLEIAAELVQQGNPNLITDVGVAAKFALAAMECATLNVEINLMYIKDRAYVDACLDAMKPMVEEGERLAGQVWHEVIRRVREGMRKQ